MFQLRLRQSPFLLVFWFLRFGSVAFASKNEVPRFAADASEESAVRPGVVSAPGNVMRREGTRIQNTGDETGSVKKTVGLLAEAVLSSTGEVQNLVKESGMAHSHQNNLQEPHGTGNKDRNANGNKEGLGTSTITSSDVKIVAKDAAEGGDNSPGDAVSEDAGKDAADGTGDTAGTAASEDAGRDAGNGAGNAPIEDAGKDASDSEAASEDAGKDSKGAAEGAGAAAGEDAGQDSGKGAGEAPSEDAGKDASEATVEAAGDAVGAAASEDAGKGGTKGGPAVDAASQDAGKSVGEADSQDAGKGTAKVASGEAASEDAGKGSSDRHGQHGGEEAESSEGTEKGSGEEAHSSDGTSQGAVEEAQSSHGTGQGAGQDAQNSDGIDQQEAESSDDSGQDVGKGARGSDGIGRTEVEASAEQKSPEGASMEQRGVAESKDAEAANLDVGFGDNDEASSDGDASREVNTAHGYLHYTMTCAHGGDLYLYPAMTVKDCATFCNANADQCAAFEFGMPYGGNGRYRPGDCQLKASASTDGCDGGFHNADLYVRVSPKTKQGRGKKHHAGKPGSGRQGKHNHATRREEQENHYGYVEMLPVGGHGDPEVDGFAEDVNSLHSDQSGTGMGAEQGTAASHFQHALTEVRTDPSGAESDDLDTEEGVKAALKFNGPKNFAGTAELLRYDGVLGWKAQKATGFSVSFTAAWDKDASGNYYSNSRVVELSKDNNAALDTITIGNKGNTNELIFEITHGSQTCGVLKSGVDKGIVDGIHDYLCSVSKDGHMKMFKEGVLLSENRKGCAPSNVQRQHLNIAAKQFHGHIENLKLWNNQVAWNSLPNVKKGLWAKELTAAKMSKILKDVEVETKDIEKSIEK